MTAHYVRYAAHWFNSDLADHYQGSFLSTELKIAHELQRVWPKYFLLLATNTNIKIKIIK